MAWSFAFDRGLFMRDPEAAALELIRALPRSSDDWSLEHWGALLAGHQVAAH